LLFEQFNLNVNVLRGVHASGYLLPTTLQEEFVPAALSGKDVFACAYAGSGKTAAFALPALQRLLTRGTSFSNGPRVLIVAPSRNAVLQAGKLLKQIGKYMRFRMTLLAQGLNGQQSAELYPDQIIDILVATPQRILSYMPTGLLDFSRLEMLVFDEADRMDPEELMTIVRTLPKQKQTLIIGNEAEGELAKFAPTILQKPAIINIETGHSSGRSLRHYLYACDDDDHKFQILSAILDERQSHMTVVVREDDRAYELQSRCQAADMNCVCISKDPQERRRQMVEFSNGDIMALITSNTDPARGNDVEKVTALIHFDVPLYPEQYLQRVAPLAQTRDNVAIVLAGAADSGSVNDIEHLMGYHFTPRTIEGLEPQLPFYRPKIKLKRDHLGRIVRRAQFNSQDGRGQNNRRNSKQKSGHLRMLRRMPKQQGH